MARRRLLLDVSPIREHREYRLLYSGQLVSFLGHQLTVVAVPYQVFLLTGSSFAVGMIGLAQLVPLVVCSLIGGAVADAVDRRKLLLAAQVLLAAASAGLALNAGRDEPALWAVYVLTALASGFAGFDAPTRSAAVPSLVPRDQLPAALALNQTLMQTGQVAGPAVAGVVIAQVSVAAAFWIDVATYGVAALALLRMQPMVPAGERTRPGLLSIGEGLRYLRGRRALQGTFLIDINAMVFGMPRALFPLLAVEAFHVGPIGLGFLYAAPGVGAMIGALLTGWVQRVRHQGRAVLWAVAVWGLAIVGFGLSTEAFALALVFLAIAGAADVISAIFRGTILQSSVPDRLRGRLSGIHIMVVVSGPRLGDFEAGLVAQLVSPVFSVVSGGVACVAGVVLIAAAVPKFRRYHAGDPA